MSLYGQSIFEEVYDYSKLESVLEEEIPVNEIAPLAVPAATVLGNVITAKKWIDVAMFVGTVGYKIVNEYKKQISVEKFNAITKYYSETDKKFVPAKGLTRKIFSCKRFFDHNFDKQKELTGIKRIFKFCYPDVLFEYSNGDKPIYSYFFTRKFDAKPTYDITKYEDSEGKTKAKIYVGGTTSGSLYDFSKSGSFYFKLNDTSLEKYKYYYLASASMKAGVNTTEAYNWIEKQYNLIKDKIEDDKK